MKENYFIACGGTGAHVMLAMVRLHILGSPFGLFISKGDGRNFPDIFLIDADDAPAPKKGECTAWQKVKELIERHPGQYDCDEAFNNKTGKLPEYSSVKPLPLFSEGEVKPSKLFDGSPHLNLLASERQRKIEYAKGMMCSPALGSLLFTLKEYEVKDQDGRPNKDPDYDKLLRVCKGKRVVVCGSYIGGTGASVAPTLVNRLRKDSQVMAVMIGRWFEFHQTGKKQQNALERNKKMKENEASGLAFTGYNLSRFSQVATVMVGVKSPQNTEREFERDNQQDLKNSHTHVIAALAGMQHFLGNKVAGGLYGVAGSDDSRLTKGIKIGDWHKGSTDTVRLEDLVIQATLFVEFLDITIEALTEGQKTGNSGFGQKVVNFVNFATPSLPKPSIVEWVDKQVRANGLKFKKVEDSLKEFRDIYEEQLKWLCEALPGNLDGVRKNAQKVSKGDRQNFSGQTLTKNLPHLGNKPNIEDITLALFHKIACWVHEELWPSRRSQASINEGQIGYWPKAVHNKGGIRPPFSDSGVLTKVKDGSISTCLEDFYRLDEINVNGWPHPIAVAQEYEFQISKDSPKALRKLEMLLVGCASGLLELEQIRCIDAAPDPVKALEDLMKTEYPDIAQYKIVDKKGTIYGFNSTGTLLCPRQDGDIDEKDWVSLWCDLTGSKKEDFDWGEKSFWGAHPKHREALECVAGWLAHLKNHIFTDWRQYLSNGELGKLDGCFGIGVWLPIVSNDSSTVLIPLPIEGKSLPPPGNQFSNEQKNKDDLVREIPSFEKVEKYYLVEDFLYIGDSRSVNLIWKGHLDEIQKNKDIFTWGQDKASKEFWYKKNINEKAIRIKNLRVIDEHEIGIKVCVPLKQSPVPGSKSGIIDGDHKYPDLPLLPSYADLAIDPNDKEWIRNNWDNFVNNVSRKRENNSLIWRLRLKGCLQEKTIIVSEIREAAKAHWMIWPNFKSVDGIENPWMAYYVYEHSTKKSLKANVVFRDKQGALSEPQRRCEGQKGFARAVKYDADKGHHSGGAPVALCASDGSDDIGIYAIRYANKLQRKGQWNLAVDFGTSHTVAAVEIDGGKANKIKLVPELSQLPSTTDSDISLHVSENWQENVSPEMQLQFWRPTYVEDGNASSISELPSDLWSFENVNQLNPTEIEKKWEPMTHYAIPIRQPCHIEDIQSHMISGFKWEMDNLMFDKKKSWLQQKYLEMAIEVFLAHEIYKRKGLPTSIQFTFTYPIRGISTQEVQNFQDSIKKLEGSMPESLGNTILNSYYYSESHAAQDITGAKKGLDVKLVADLGGGTLDVFVSADSNKGLKFDEVADSIMLGGNHLLKIMEKDPDKYLPTGWGPGVDDQIAELSGWSTFEKLRAWMRLEGASKLLGEKFSQGYESRHLKGLRGFPKTSATAANARDLVDRYFGLITDFLARNIVAYVKNVLPKIKDGYPKHLEEIKLYVKIQGNGWRLWYDESEYEDIQKEVEKWVRIRAKQLCENDDFWVDGKDDLWEESDTSPDPKHEQVKKALGKNMPPGKVLDKIHRHPLIDLSLRYSSVNQEDEPKNWFSPLPFEIGKSKSKPKPILKEFNPPLCIDIPDEGQPINSEILSINNTLMLGIRGDFDEKSTLVAGKLSVPVELVWETVLKSEEIEKGK